MGSEMVEGLEQDTYELYERIAQEETDNTTKIFYASLAREEQTHYEILAETLQYLDNPGEWYRKTERWILEG